MNKKKKISVRIDKVYTKGGDQGETSLGGGGRVSKDNLRIEAFGTVDELNSILGMVRCVNLNKPLSNRRDKLDLILNNIQQKLFDLGSELATKPNKESNMLINEENVIWIETIVDAMNEELHPLNSFVLSGAGELGSYLHYARTVCRRAERRVVALNQKDKIGKWILPYINRLSDALFVFSRWTVLSLDEKEILWEPGKTDPKNWNWIE
tara:strand:- start:6787 stop:7413 length:627 start_codon:yes stop_codon:yes gene_type:complete